MPENRNAYFRQYQARRRIERQASKEVALAAIDMMLERAAAAEPAVFRGVLEAAHTARKALEAA